MFFSVKDHDGFWRELQKIEQWELPARAPLLLRLPIIRNVRFAYHAARINRHNRQWESVGLLPTGYDEWVLYAIARGWC